MNSSVANDASQQRAISPRVIEQAADWLVRVTADDVTEAECIACRRWRDERPDHELAWQRLTSLWEGFEPAKEPTARAALTAGLSLRPRRAVVLAIATTLLLPALAVWLTRPDVSTAPGELRSVQLPDDSRLTLDGGSAIDIDFNASERRIHLRSGLLQVDVAHDPQRPFVVETGFGSARAIGTRYTVQQGVSGSEVSVQASSVRACNRRDQCVDLQPGDSVRLDDIAPLAVGQRDPDAATAWMRGQLVVDDMALAEVLQRLSAQYRGGLRFDIADLAGLRVSGVLPLHDVERALDVLARTQPVTVERPWWGGLTVKRVGEREAR